MFLKPGHLNFYLYRHPTDMRKSFDGLSCIVSTARKQDPLSGDVYVFFNKRRDRLKLMVWDDDGFWIYYKRLEKGTFQIPVISHQDSSVVLPYEQLLMILQGIDLGSVKKRKRYKRYSHIG